MARPGRRPDDLSTIEAAAMLGLSRQRVSELFDEGVLAGHRVGTHRRIRRTAVEAMLAERTRAMAPSDVLTLWLSRLAAAHIAMDPAGSFAAARRWLTTVEATRPEAGTYVVRWQRILDAGPEAAMRILTALDPESLSLQNMSPFTATLPADERERVTHAALDVGR